MLKISRAGWVEEANICPSPHCDLRPQDATINTIIVHAISLPPNDFTTSAVEAFFTGKLCADEHPYFQTIENLRVSAHVFIRRDGRILQFVPFDLRAWHAGKSEFKGQVACNDFSIGIELEGSDEVPFMPKQYDTLVSLIKRCQARYPEITADRVVGHHDVSPGRKTDPGPLFNWLALKRALAQEDLRIA